MLNLQGFGVGAYSLYTAMGNPAFYRGVAATAGTIASLPLKTYKNDPDTDERSPSSSFLDRSPSGPYGLTPFAWKELIAFALISEGEVGLDHINAQSGALVGLMPLHPSTYTAKWVKKDGVVMKEFQIQGQNEPKYSDSFTQILGMSVDGLRGLSPVVLFQRGIQLAVAMDVASMRVMTSGMQAGGFVFAADEDVDEDDAKAISDGLQTGISGPDNAGRYVFVNKRLKFQAAQQTNQDAQFEQGR